MNSRLRKRKILDRLYTSITYIVSFVGVFTLGAILWYVISTGGSLLSWGLLTGDSADINTDVYTEELAANYPLTVELEDGIFYSQAWGIGIMDSKDREGHDIVTIEYLHPDSPLSGEVLNKNSVTEDDKTVNITIGVALKQMFSDNGIALDKYGAESFVNSFEGATSIKSITVQKFGGGIRGSLITTLYMILLTLAIALPIGVMTAIYLNEYAPKKSAVTRILRSMIDMLTGVPSIIYGLMGAAVFIPFFNKIAGTSGGSIYSGSLTMAVILLPVIIKNTEEALKVIPDDIRSASLALGASKTQTTFRVILPSAVTGILTGILLGIGRIIGESAALIYAVGAAIRDNVQLGERSTTLAVHIWTVMGGEVPNYELASAIAIIILIVVLALTLIIKFAASRLTAKWQ